MTTDAPSKRALAGWKRLADTYGLDTMERKYGTRVPRDWCEVLDGINRKRLDAVMVQVRAKHPAFPPSLGEFEAIVRDLDPPVSHSTVEPTMAERLTAFVARTKPLTPAQLRASWRVVGVGDASNRGPGKSDPNFRIIGVIVPADGEHPGYRVMVEDMEAEASPAGAEPDAWQRAADAAMFRVVATYSPAEDLLKQLIDAKNKLAADYRLIAQDDAVSPGEVRAAVLRRLRQLCAEAGVEPNLAGVFSPRTEQRAKQASAA